MASHPSPQIVSVGYSITPPSFKTLIALKTRNGIIISPHPRAKNCTIEASKIVLEAAVMAGAPEGIIDWIDVPSLELTNLVMKESNIILEGINYENAMNNDDITKTNATISGIKTNTIATTGFNLLK